MFVWEPYITLYQLHFNVLKKLKKWRGEKLQLKGPLHSFSYSNLIFRRNKITCFKTDCIRRTARPIHLRFVQETSRSSPTSVKKSYRKYRIYKLIPLDQSKRSTSISYNIKTEANGEKQNLHTNTFHQIYN